MRVSNRHISEIRLVYTTLLSVDFAKVRYDAIITTMMPVCTGMAPVQVPENVIDLSKYIDPSKYFMTWGVHPRLTSSYHAINFTYVTKVNDPGLYTVTLQD